MSIQPGMILPDSADLAQALLQRRRSLGLSQPELAELADVSERFVRLVEAGKDSVRLDKLNALLAVLGLELHARLRQVSDA